MPQGTPIDPQTRALAKSVAAQVVEIVPQIAARMSGGKLSFSAILWLASALAQFAAQTQVVVHAPGGPAALAGELFDAYTGSDPTALKFMSADFLPGLDPTEAEDLADKLKDILEEVILRKFGTPPVA